MAQKIIITAKQVTVPVDGMISFPTVSFSNTLGDYMVTNVNFVNTASNFSSEQIKYNFGSGLIQ